jgi:hypothetical protein
MMPFKFFVGAYHGSGKQWISWIHINDIVNLYSFLIENSSISGPINGTSPDPVRNVDFIKAAGKLLNRNFILPAPSFAIRLAAGEFAEGILTGQKAYPEKALASGFTFEFPDINSALKNLLTK